MSILHIANRLAGTILLATLVGAGSLRAHGPSPEKLVVSYVSGNAIY
jgi:hypothetical protein